MREDISSLKISLIGGGGEGSNLLMNSSLNIPYFFLKSSLRAKLFKGKVTTSVQLRTTLLS